MGRVRVWGLLILLAAGLWPAQAQRSPVYLPSCEATGSPTARDAWAARLRATDHYTCVDVTNNAQYTWEGDAWIELQGAVVPESELLPQYLLAKTDPGAAVRGDLAWLDFATDQWPAADVKNWTVLVHTDIVAGETFGTFDVGPGDIYRSVRTTAGNIPADWALFVEAPESEYVNPIIGQYLEASTGQNFISGKEIKTGTTGPRGYYPVDFMDDRTAGTTPAKLNYFLTEYGDAETYYAQYLVRKNTPGFSTGQLNALQTFQAINQQFSVDHSTGAATTHSFVSSGITSPETNPWQVEVTSAGEYWSVFAKIKLTQYKREFQFYPVTAGPPDGGGSSGWTLNTDVLRDTPVRYAHLFFGNSVELDLADSTHGVSLYDATRTDYKAGDVVNSMGTLYASVTDQTVANALTDATHWRRVGSELVDDLTTGGTDKALTAEQGRVLKTLIDGIGERVSVADNAAMAADTTSPDGTTFFVIDDGAQVPIEWGLYQRIGGADQRVLGQDDLIAALLALTDAQATDRTDTTVGLIAGGKQLYDVITSFLTYTRVEAEGQTLLPWGRYAFNMAGSPTVTTAVLPDGTVDGEMVWLLNNAATTTPNGVRVDGNFYVPAFDTVISWSVNPQDVWLPAVWNDRISGWIYEDFARGPELWTNASSGGGLAPNSTYLAKTTNPTVAIMPEIVAWKMGVWFSPENTGAISFFLNTPTHRFVLPDGSISDGAYIPGRDVIYVEFVADSDGINQPRWVVYEQNKPFSVGEWKPGEAVTTQTERIAPRVSDGALRLWKSKSVRETGPDVPGFDQAEQDNWDDLGGYVSPGVRAYLVRPETNAPTGGTTVWRDAGGGENAVPHVADGDTRNGTNACRYAGASFQYCRRYVPDGGILDTIVISAQNEGRTTPIVLRVAQDGREILRVADIVPDFADGAGYVDVSYTLPYPIVSDAEDVEILTVGVAEGGASFRIAEIGYAGGIRVARPVIKQDDGSLTTDAGVPVTPAANESLVLDLLSLPWPGIWEQDPSAAEWRLIGVPTERPPVPTQDEIESTELIADTQITLTGDRFRQGVEALVNAPIVRQPDTTELPYRTTNVSVDAATYALPVAPITDRIVGLSIQAGHTVTLPAPFGVVTNTSTERWYRAFAYNGASWEMYSAATAANDDLWTQVSAAYTASCNDRLAVFDGDVTLPADAPDGCFVLLTDAERDFDANNVNVLVGATPASQTIGSNQPGVTGAASFLLDVPAYGNQIIFVYDENATPNPNWFVLMSSLGDPVPRLPLKTYTLTSDLLLSTDAAETIVIDPGGADRSLTVSGAVSFYVKVASGQAFTVSVAGTSPVRVLAPGERAKVSSDGAGLVETF